MSRPPQIESLESRRLLSAAPGIRPQSVPWADAAALRAATGSAAASSATRHARAQQKGDPATTALSPTDVQQILAAAGSQALPTQAVAVVDREGSLLGVYTGTGINVANINPVVDLSQESLETGIVIRAVQRARTAAFFQSSGEAFTTRTARFIIQNNFPEGVRNTGGGPLYGVEFSSLPGSDILAKAIDATGDPIGPGVATGISGDPGGVPLFIHGIPVGGIGVAGDLKDVAPAKSLIPAALVGGDAYGKAANPKGRAFDAGNIDGKELSDVDESVAMAGAFAYRAPAAIQATQIVVGGLRLPFTASRRATGKPAQSLAQLQAGGAHTIAVPPLGLPTADLRAGEPERTNATFAGVPGLLRITNNAGFVNADGTPDTSNPHRDPQDSDQIIASNDAAAVKLTAQDVRQVITDAVAQASVTRAGIRKPNGVNAVVHVAVVDRDGTVLGVFRMEDGTNFSYDVAVQKARTADFFSDDTHAFSATAIGFLSQKFFPAGINHSKAGVPGPLFGLQDALSIGPTGSTRLDAPSLTNGPLHNGITIFPGGEPLYKDGVLVGAVGISGDGVTQDDIITYAGTSHFRPPPTAKRSDQLDGQQIADYLTGRVTALVNATGVNVPQSFIDQARERLPKALKDTGLPYAKFPRNPHV